MKYPSILIAILVLASCGGEVTLESKTKELDTKKAELITLQGEISKLAEEVEELDPNSEVEEDLGILVSVQNIAPQTFSHYIEVNGAVQAEELANVSPEQGGQIKQILVREGDRVTKGQTMATLNTAIIRSSLEELDNGIALAQTVYDRQSRLWQQKIGSEIQYLKAKNDLESLQMKKATLVEQMSMSTIKAPFNGMVEQVWQKVGELASPGMPLITVVDMSKMKVLADVSEAYASVVTKNTIVNVDLPSFGKTMDAPIRSVGNVINPMNRSFAVEVSIPNHDMMVKPNAMATIRIKDFNAEDALVVPAIAIGKDGKGDFLFVVQEGKAVKTYVSTGRSSKGHTMVSEGLSVGDSVVVKGNNEVANGDPVRIQG